jgi:transcriptional regulator with XRE-family HTH domain
VAKNCHCKYASGKILTLSEQIGGRLREQRSQFGLTQDQLAETLGVSKRTQGNYETGTSDPTASYLSKAASQLGFDVPYILSGQRTTSTESSLSEVEDSIVQMFRRIPDFDQKAILRILKGMADDAARGSN